jgi:hypothetical protein
VPHFIGLHAVQALPLLVLLLTRAGVGRAQRERLMRVAGPNYAALCLILLMQTEACITERGRTTCAPV